MVENVQQTTNSVSLCVHQSLIVSIKQLGAVLDHLCDSNCKRRLSTRCSFKMLYQCLSELRFVKQLWHEQKLNRLNICPLLSRAEWDTGATFAMSMQHIVRYI